VLMVRRRRIAPAEANNLSADEEARLTEFLRDN
jgi:hypothetical protein